MVNEIKDTAPSINVMVERSLANFSNQQGVQKLYSLLEAVEILKQYIIVNFTQEFLVDTVNEELKKVEGYKVKNYEQLEKFIEKSRKDINEVQFIYDYSKNKKSSGKINFGRIISKKVSPYQRELYFLFVVLLKVSSIQNRTISRELLRSPDELNKNIESFEKHGNNRIPQH